MSMLFSRRIRKRHIKLMDWSDIPLERPYSVPDFSDTGFIFDSVYEQGYTIDNVFAPLAHTIVDDNDYLREARDEAVQLKDSADKAFKELNGYIKSIKLPDAIAESAKNFHVADNGTIDVKIERAGIMKLLKLYGTDLSENQIMVCGTFILTADNLYPSNKELFGEMQKAYKIIEHAAERTKELNELIAKDLRPAMGDAIKRYAVKTIMDTPRFSLSSWCKRRKIRFSNCKLIFDKVRNYNVDPLVPVFSYAPKLSFFKDAIDKAQKKHDSSTGPEPGQSAQPSGETAGSSQQTEENKQ